MTRNQRAEERRWRRGEVLAAVLALVLGASVAWILLSVQQLAGELHTANEARDALAVQVQRLGGKPVTGPPGSRGDVGGLGPRGPRGPSGKPGGTGPSGKPGDNGKSGKAGKSGDAGESGPPGNNGPAGDPGSNGNDGPSGSVGPAGPQGETGPQGEQGPRGEQGEQGPAPSSWTFTYLGVTYTCTPASPGSTNYSCSGNGPLQSSDTRPQAAALDPRRQTI